MEIVNTRLLRPTDYPYWDEGHADYSYWRERYKEVKNHWGDIGVEHVGLERIKNIDEEFREVMAKLARIGGLFLGYDMGGGHLAQNWYDVSNWIARIKSIKRLTTPLDIKNAILQEMDRQERGKGLVLETLASQPGQVKGKAAETPIKVEQKVLLKLEVATRDTYWKGKGQEILPEIPYKILYALARRPSKTLKYKTLGDILTAIAIKERKALSKHIQTITARIPPLRDYIENIKEVGYILRLTEAEIEIEGELKEIDDLLE